MPFSLGGIGKKFEGARASDKFAYVTSAANADYRLCYKMKCPKVSLTQGVADQFGTRTVQAPAAVRPGGEDSVSVKPSGNPRGRTGSGLSIDVFREGDVVVAGARLRSLLRTLIGHVVAHPRPWLWVVGLATIVVAAGLLAIELQTGRVPTAIISNRGGAVPI